MISDHDADIGLSDEGANALAAVLPEFHSLQLLNLTCEFFRTLFLFVLCLRASLFLQSVAALPIIA